MKFPQRKNWNLPEDYCTILKEAAECIIAIIRDMEKNKVNPTLALLQSLFEETEPKKKPLIVEKKLLGEKQEICSKKNCTT